jgi:hypothetical protein
MVVQKTNIGHRNKTEFNQVIFGRRRTRKGERVNQQMIHWLSHLYLVSWYDVYCRTELVTCEYVRRPLSHRASQQVTRLI